MDKKISGLQEADCMLNLLEDNFWRALISIIALGSTVATIVNFFKPIDQNASFTEKIKRALLIVVIFFVVAASVILFLQETAYSSQPGKNTSPQKVFALNTSTPNPHTQIPPTVTVRPTTSTVNPHTQIPPIATVRPTTSTQGSFTIPSTWTQKINDPLTIGSQWVIDGSTCTLGSDGYVVTSKGPNYCNYDAPVHDFPDLAYSISITLHQGYMGGLIFRLASNNYYGFYITTQGKYQVLWHADANGGNDTSIDPANSPVDSFKFSSALRQGLDQKNILSVLAQGTLLQFWINGQKVASVQDSTYRNGTIGVFAGDPTDLTSVTSATFNNAQVWTP